MEQPLLDYLDTKPHLSTVIFNIRDIFLCHKNLSKATISKRRSLASQMYHQMKTGPLQITGWEITLHSKSAILSKYRAVRT